MTNEQTIGKHAWETPVLQQMVTNGTESGGVVNTETASYGPNS